MCAKNDVEIIASRHGIKPTSMEYQKQLIRFIHRHPGITIQDLVKKLNDGRTIGKTPVVKLESD